MAQTIAFVGPMNAGKTFCIIEQLRNFVGRKFIFDQVNTRNSDRDLNNLYPELMADTLPDNLDENCLVVIDEVHLYQVFKKENILFTAFEKAQRAKCKIFLAGVILDCYTRGQLFKIWEDLIPRLDVIYNLKSRNPCYKCGSTINVFFSAPANFGAKGKERVGDDYHNVCKNCFDKLIWASI